VQRNAMHIEHAAWQSFMLASSEWAFFNSAPVFLLQIERQQRSRQPIDLLVCSFTLTGIAMLCSEKFGLPMTSFCAQPAVIPTADPAADPRLFQLQQHTAFWKARMERGVIFPLNLSRLRKQCGLTPDVDTWRTMFEQQVPVIIPIHPSTLAKPADWGAHITFTDFIFLRGLSVGLNKALQTFLRDAKAAGRKLCLVTFSSMPVSRRAMLRCVVKMLQRCKHRLAIVYVGTLPDDTASDPHIEAVASGLKAEGRFCEAASADFGELFPQMDAFVVHGGLGSTVEALRTRKPVGVTGILLFDQRFWGSVCEEKGVGPPPQTLVQFERCCVDFVDRALDPTSQYVQAAARLSIGDPADDGVATNVRHFAELLENGQLRPVITTEQRSAGKLTSRDRQSLCGLCATPPHRAIQSAPDAYYEKV